MLKQILLYCYCISFGIYAQKFEDILAIFPQDIARHIMKCTAYLPAPKVWYLLWCLEKLSDEDAKKLRIDKHYIIKEYIISIRHKLITGKLKNTGIITACAVLPHLSKETRHSIHTYFKTKTIYNCSVFNMHVRPYFIPKETFKTCIENKTPLHLFDLKQTDPTFNYVREVDTETTSLTLLNQNNEPFQKQLIRVGLIGEQNPEHGGALLLFIRDIESPSLETLLISQLPLLGELNITPCLDKRDYNTLQRPLIPNADLGNVSFEWFSRQLLYILHKTSASHAADTIKWRINDLRKAHALPAVSITQEARQGFFNKLKKLLSKPTQ